MQDIKKLSTRNIIPGLAVILVGDNPASKIYVKKKQKFFLNSNCHSETFTFNSTISEDELIKFIKDLNLEIGCEVEVIRSGEIIPRIVRRVDW